MNTVKDTAQIELLLSELAGSFIEHPEAIKVGCQHSEDGQSTLWIMKCHRDDEAKLVGRSGCHVDALAFIVSSLGKIRGKEWTFRLITVKANGAPFEEAKAAITFDPLPSADLLANLIAALEIEASFRVGPGNGSRDRLSFVFTVEVADEDAYVSLYEASEHGETIKGAIDTLWRAAAKFHGVRFAVNVVKVP